MGSSVNPWLERRVLHYAHRGGAKEAPENTLAAFRHGVAAGAHGLELDVRATRDGTLVVIHDADLDRVTDARGSVADLTVDDVRAVAVTTGPDAYDGEDLRIPLLEEVLVAFPDVILNIDVKATAPDVTPYEDTLADLLREHGRSTDVIVGSFVDAALERFRGAAPEIPTSAGPREVASLWSGDWRAPEDARLVAVQVPTTYGDIEVVSADFVGACHAAGLAVHVWTIDDPSEMRRLIALGVDGIMTDRPRTLRAVLDDLGAAWR